MKKFIATLFMTLFLFSSSANAECVGTDVTDLRPAGTFAVCWDKVDAPEVTGYRLYISTVSNELGTLVSTFPQSACGDTDCDRTDMVAPLEEGNFFYKVTAYSTGREVTYDRWNDETQEYESQTYTMPPEESEPSNEVVAIIVQEVKPDRPVGCSIRPF